MNDAARHLALLTRTTEVVNSSLDLQEVMEAIAHEVASALATDACFVYLYDARADELVLRATRGSRVEEMTRTPRMRPGEGVLELLVGDDGEVKRVAEAAPLTPLLRYPSTVAEAAQAAGIPKGLLTPDGGWETLLQGRDL